MDVKITINISTRAFDPCNDVDARGITCILLVVHALAILPVIYNARKDLPGCYHLRVTIYI